MERCSSFVDDLDILLSQWVTIRNRRLVIERDAVDVQGFDHGDNASNIGFAVCEDSGNVELRRGCHPAVRRARMCYRTVLQMV